MLQKRAVRRSMHGTISQVLCLSLCGTYGVTCSDYSGSFA